VPDRCKAGGCRGQRIIRGLQAVPAPRVERKRHVPLAPLCILLAVISRGNMVKQRRYGEMLKYTIMT
jgi:hypothetical protein